MGAEQDLLAERYGRRPSEPSANSRGRWLVFTAVTLTLAVLAIGWAALGRQRTSLEWLDLGVQAESTTDSSITTTFQVVTPSGVGAICTVRALNPGLLEVGRQDVVIPADNQGRTTRTITLRTTERANIAGVKTCVRAAGLLTSTVSPSG